MNLLYRRFNNDDDASKFVKGLNRIASTASCYYVYGSHYNGAGDNPIYFGFLADPKINDLIEEINSSFKNIKIIIVGQKNVKTGYPIFDKDGKFKFLEEFNWILFRIELSEKYIQQANFILTLALAQFLRGYCPEYTHFRKVGKIENNFIDNMLLAQASSSYGAWLCCDRNRNYSCSRDVFNRLDDIKFINKNTEHVIISGMPSISSFINVIKGELSKEDINDDADVYDDNDYDEDD